MPPSSSRQAAIPSSSGDTLNTTTPRAGTYIDSSATDTIWLVDYVIHPSHTTFDSITACDSLTWHGTTYTSSTQSFYPATNIYGCDSSFVLNLVVYPSVSTQETIFGCDSLYWNNRRYLNSTDITEAFSTVNGCDSTVTHHIVINPSYEDYDTLTACDTLFWQGNFYTESANTTEQLTTVSGCDSITHYHLVVNHSAISFIFDTIASGTYTWNDSIYTSSGTYMQIFSTEQGCDSIVMLKLTILNGGTQGIENPESPQAVTLYPNPTNGQLTIDADDILKVEVLDNTGRLVVSYIGTNQFDLSHLPTGNYLLRISLKNGSATCRVIKQ